MEVATLKGSLRSETGSKQVRRLRGTGMVPGIIYGGTGQPINIAIDDREVERELRQHHRVFKIEIGGKTEAVYMQEVQYHVLTDQPLHLDFKRIDLEADLELEIEINFLGHPTGLSKGGRLIKDHNSILVRTKPQTVPEEIAINIAKLDLNQSITVEMLELPEGVVTDLPADTIICHITVAKAEEIEEPGPEAEGGPEGDAEGGTEAKPEDAGETKD